MDRNYAVGATALTRGRWTSSINCFPTSGTPDFDGSIEQLKDALFGRLHWLDEHIGVLRQYSHESAVKNSIPELTRKEAAVWKRFWRSAPVCWRWYCCTCFWRIKRAFISIGTPEGNHFLYPGGGEDNSGGRGALLKLGRGHGRRYSRPFRHGLRHRPGDLPPLVRADSGDGRQLHPGFTPILQDDFYEAFYEYNKDREELLYLLHGLWVDDYVMYLHRDAFDPEYLGALIEDGRTLIDILHGNKTFSLSRRPGKRRLHPGYLSWVLGYILGGGVEDTTVAYTDHMQKEKKQLPGGNTSLQ